MNMERFLELWGTLPTTQVRITVTMGAFVATTGRYVMSDTWTPAYEWLAFLLLMAGVDALQYLGKRTTDSGYVAAKMGTPPAPVPTDPATTA